MRGCDDARINRDPRVAGIGKEVEVEGGTTNIELPNYPPLMEEYVAAMFLPHTDRRLFPSVEY
jgi:hypothetical protein